MEKSAKTMDKIVALAKGRGFIYPGSEIYGGLANTWDYGNLGVEVKNNVKTAWWQKFVQESPYNVGVDCAILMNPQTWVASGHLGGFSDPLMDCKECHERFRADKIIEDFAAENNITLETSVDGWSHEEMEKFINDHNVPCPSCGKHDFTSIREFNLMFKTFQGVTEDAKDTVYLRPETAQGIFVNFKNVQRSSRKKVPFGICQVGKSFRNEITPGNFTFRTREFEQMELSSAMSGFFLSESRKRTFVFATMILRSFHSTLITQQISSTHSYSQSGASFGALLQEQITTLHVTRRHQASLWITSMMRQMRSTSHTLLSLHLVQTV